LIDNLHITNCICLTHVTWVMHTCLRSPDSVYAWCACLICVRIFMFGPVMSVCV
jgi:hypothetical protein